MASSSYNETGRCACFWDYLVTMTRLWGILTAAVMSGVGVDLTYHGHNIGVCVLIGSLLVFFLEIAWALLLFLHVCLRQDDGQPVVGGAGECARATVQWCDKPSKKGMLYIVLGAVILLWPQHRLWLSPVAGVMLLLLATLYFLLTFKARGETRDTLLQGRDESFDRFDEVSDVLDDSLPEPILRRPIPNSNSLDTQLTPQFAPHMARSASSTLMAHHTDAEAVPHMDAGSGLIMASRPSGTAERHTHALVDGFGDQEIILKM